MNPFLIVLLLIAAFVVWNSIVIVPNDKRGGVFLLGKFTKVLNPGFNIVLPLVNKVELLDLNKDLPGWQGYSPEQIKQKICEVLTYGATLRQPATPRTLKREAQASSPQLENFIAWMLEQVERQIGVPVKNDQLVRTRVSEQAQKALQEIPETGSFTFDLPFIAADASGPKHFRMTVEAAALSTL